MDLSHGTVAFTLLQYKLTASGSIASSQVCISISDQSEMPDGKSRDNMLTTKLANGDWPSSLVGSPPTHRCGRPQIQTKTHCIYYILKSFYDIFYFPQKCNDYVLAFTVTYGYFVLILHINSFSLLSKLSSVSSTQKKYT